MKRILALAFLMQQFFAFSQVTIRGRITEDSSGAIIAGASILFPELNTGTLSSEKGTFAFTNIPKGRHIIQITRLGYKSKVQRLVVTDSISDLIILLQQDRILFDEIVIYGTQNNSVKRTANNIDNLSVKEMQENGALSLSDGIARMPGVSQLTTGIGISKPVIRGLFGNRIQTILLGMRFDNQQWQDEHGLGLSDAGVEKTEIIKGPSALLYGSEAMGGVLNIIEEKAAPVGVTKADLNMRYFSNTQGYSVNAGVRSSNTKFNWRLRAGNESHADYSDGNGNRVLNSRFDGSFAKASLGFHLKKWVSDNNYLFALNNFGFILEAATTQDTPDDRWNRKFEKPHHTVAINLFTSQNTFFLRSSKLKVNIGTHINNRQEQEGGNKVSLNMLLNTYSINALWIKSISDNTELTIGTQDMYQTNRNNGSRIIVPDADLFESSIYSYISHTRKRIVIEAGVRYDKKNIQTYSSGEVNTNGGAVMLPFNNWYDALNGSCGISINPGKHITLKANSSTGFRAGNLAEQSSNGLHEGTLRYEIGNPDLRTEHNVCGELMSILEWKQFYFSIAAYNNHFFNYIYLAPTGKEYIGFPEYRYIQKNADLRGGEVVIDFHPELLKWMSLKANYSIVDGVTDTGENLPFVPPAKLNGEIRANLKKTGTFSETYLKGGATHLFDQTKPAQFETSTPGYTLLYAGLGTKLQLKKNSLVFSLICNNLLNETYYDHLSRFKYYGIYNIGRNFALKLNYLFN
ncbi:MAG: TonB-dependent receptor [Bacteroidia bacterium]